jgi:hypothetical protein
MGKIINGTDIVRPKQRRSAGKNRHYTKSELGKQHTDSGTVQTPSMMNCWEFKNCGRQPGGKHVAELGLCPAATDSRYHEINNGVNGGRFCWLVEQTMCFGVVEHSFLDKFERCLQCDFYKQVHRQEKRRFQQMANKFLDDK